MKKDIQLRTKTGLKLYTKYILSLLLIINSSTLAFSQDQFPYHVHHYNVSNGLSNNWISQLFQDKDGFIWVATQYGLNRFDGKKFTTFTYRPGDSTSISANWIKYILETSNGDFYLATHGGGINQMDHSKEVFYNPLDQLKLKNEFDVVSSLMEDEYQNIYISTENGVYKFHKEKKELEKVYPFFSRKVATWKNDTLLMATAKGIAKSFGTEYSYLPVLEGQNIAEIFVINTDSVLAYGGRTLYLLTSNKGVWSKISLDFKTSHKPNSFYWPSIIKDQTGSIWIIGGKSICKYDQGFRSRECFSIQSIFNDIPIKDFSVHCILNDQEGNIWLGSNQGVFQLIPHKKFRNKQFEKKGFSFAGTREVIECGQTMWLATHNGLFKWRKGNNSDPELINNRGFMALHCGSDGYLYSDKLGDQNAIYRFDLKTSDMEIVTITDTTKLSGGACWRIIEDSEHRLWIARWNHIICHDLKTNQSFKIQLFKNGKAIELSILDMNYDSEDNLWLGSQDEGLIKIPSIRNIKKGNSVQYEQYLYDENDPNSISSNLILSLHKTDKGILWVGTDGGLNRMNPSTGKFKRFLRSVAMPDDKILSISSDKNGTLWIGTISHGIFSYQPSLNQFNVYNTQDGLYDDGMLLSSVFRNEDGMIWMGSTNGLHAFHPDSIEIPTNYIPNLVWLSTTRHRQDTTLVEYFPKTGLDKKNPVPFFAEDISVTWDFSTLTFKQPDEVRYRFRLKGYHKNWLPTQETGLLTLTQLPRGSYELEVESFTLGRNWSVRHDAIFIKVFPPWYQTKFAYSLYLLGTLVFIIGLYRLQLKRKIAETEKEHLQNLNQAKSHWFSRIAHEFRTPLTVILGSLDQFKSKQKESEEEEKNKHLDQIKTQTNYLSQQVGQILEIAKMKEGHLKLNNQPGDFISFQKYLLRSFSSMADEKNIQLQFSSSITNLSILFDEDKWRKISSNLLSNAIKYSPEGGEVNLSIENFKKENQLWISLKVKDNGFGMTPNFIKQLFDPFTREEATYAEGVGLGMAFTKELVELMQGNIEVNSEVKVGSTFEVYVPVQETIKEENKMETPQLVHKENSTKPLVLIAEDHAEILNYIQFCLAPNYNVITANNGRTAWELCQEHIPDLVISDIMMPEWTGLELSKAIRETLSTDHIPVILLTAKASHDAQLEGLKTGADVYLQKPFNREELMIRVNRLIEVRAKLITKFQKGDFKQEIANEKIDSFLQSIVEAIERNMDNENFTVLQLAESVFMSRVHLFRKIKSVAGMSPTIFIRKVRLKKSKELLGQQDLTIAEIAYQTGFKDPAYFTRVFVEEFGKTPTQFRK